MKKKLNRRRFKAKNDKGQLIADITAISIVKNPAIEKGFQLFVEEELPKKINFQVSNEEKMIISGPIMCANQDILRKDMETGELYYCYFTEQDVRDFSEIYMRYAKKNQANLDHGDVFLKDFFICESWIVEDEKMDKAVALGFKEVKAGDWYGSYRCVNPKMWEELKNSDFTGFSVEISLDDFNEENIKNIVFDESLTEEERLERIKKIIYGD